MLFYERAADILLRLERRQGSIKTMTIGNQHLKSDEKRKMYALICETLKHASALITVVRRSGILAAEKIDLRLALVLVHDLLLKNVGLQRQGANQKLNQSIRKHKAKLVAELARLKEELGIQSNDDLVPAGLRDSGSTFRYVRINLLAATVDGVSRYFQDEGYELVDFQQVERSMVHHVLKVKSRTFMRDPDLHDLLVFPPGTDLHAHPLYLGGSIILQDKASCMPAHVVRPAAGSTVLDACAAPGNKTSHMASLMGNSGRIFAFDMDRRRLDTLIKLTNSAKCEIITAQCISFLDLNPLDPQYASVEYALLDPSCSGSGIVSRLDALVDTYIAAISKKDESEGTDAVGAGQESRLKNLADFQTSIILHAMRFPNVKRISYSTCSVHDVENEAVVARVLQSQDEFGLASAKDVIPTWPRRGLETAGLTKDQAACLVRTLPEDGTNGFFVAGFVRQKPADIDRTKQQLEDLRAAVDPGAAGTTADRKSNQNHSVKGKKKRRGVADVDNPRLPSKSTKRAKPKGEVATTVAPLTNSKRSHGKKGSRRKAKVAVTQ
ncbi:hypothetical protein IW140_004754 [Coemansia sp. RSA 1813]|nr:hypothetical protein EV178_004788 [Coemansia sp. RSA 1646]KAJ1768984.1 hypothetical protein LPJ74_004414 [Coemansia sp. RSA 1843]KAJ2087584.1 hypothetical protein IW138_004867 [Coemansia sp. RSA 986]KAJ2212534.1 hypothetical protein EV179_004586 [Coemansia sp. RSA 487]KAJ2566891.1 hypothetical protein IW140_004754 [Coemansia sp. RSA 1813]